MKAIEHVESGGNNDKVGKDGEISALQFMPATFRAYSIEVLGYIARPSKVNAEYIAAKKIEKWMEQDKSIETVALHWNSGLSSSKCSSGYNKAGHKFDSCAYVAMVAANY